MNFGAAEAAIVDHVLHGRARFVAHLLPVVADHELIGTMQVRVDETDGQALEEQPALEEQNTNRDNFRGKGDVGEFDGLPGLNVTGLLAGEPIPCGTVIWEFHPGITDDGMGENMTGTVKDTLPGGEVGSVADDRSRTMGSNKELNEISMKLDETERITGLANPRVQGLRCEAIQNPIKGSYGDLSHAVFIWEPCSAVQRLGLEALYNHPAGRTLLLYVIISAYPSLALPGYYVILNNRLRLAKYVSRDANVSVRRSCAKVKVKGEKQVIFVDQVVATRDIAPGDEITRDFKTIKEMEDVENKT